MDRENIKNDLIAYLYGEMSTEERLRFEKEMESDPDLEKEFLELKQLRKGLGQLEDKEVMEPFFLWGKNGSQGWTKSFKRRPLLLFKPIVAIAASLVVLLLVGYITKFSIVYDENRLFIGFNQQAVPASAEPLSQEDIMNLVRNEVDRNNQSILAKLEDNEDKMDNRFASLEAKQEKISANSKASGTLSESELQEYYTQMRQANATLMENYLRNATVQQQEYFQTVMNQFTEYLQDQRAEDLRLIRRSLVNLKENQDQQQQETQQILATLLNNANTQNN